jgi:glycosyltransferase involved in cell wall biosynthesis
MKILVNTISTKKHSGGAYQIAYNFLMKTLEHQEVEWVYVVSADLDEILPEPMKERKNYHVYSTQPDYRHTYKKVKNELKELVEKEKPDVVYSITAPSYFTFDTVEVMRFTNPWVTHPNKYSWATMSLANRLKTRLYCWNQRRMMRKASYFVTQTETTKKGIMRITGVPSENVKVVNNVLPQIFKSLPKTPKDQDGNWIDVACVGAPVPHKNFDIIPAVVKELKALGVENVRFHVTVPTGNPLLSMYNRKLGGLGLSDRIITHGRCSQIELAEMYRGCQLCFLPTLLEVFSASTLEAMNFHLPVVATDFDFNSEVMGDSCLYYEPMNAKDAAIQIKKYVESKELREEMKNKMDERLKLFGDYDKHFNEILAFLKEVAEKQKKIR